MTATFVPCDACARHVRQDESACPFCGTRSERRSGLVTGAVVAAGAGIAAAVLAARVLVTPAYGGPPLPAYGGPPFPQMASPPPEIGLDAGGDPADGGAHAGPRSP
jgi:hypothetical protein